MIMRLKQKYFRPFDQIYRTVTARMWDRACRLPLNSERNWLTQIVVDFQRERDRWPDSPPLDPYRIQWERLRFRVVRLVASVFLHVSYDLPRVLAINWPARGEWAGGPSEPRGEWLYIDLRSIFSDVLSTSARRLQVTGVYAPILWCVPLPLIHNVDHWVGRLREAAWRHGRTLADLDAPDRADTEQRMIQAMSPALGEVNNLPWTFTLPEPPDAAMRGVAIAPALLVDPQAFAATVLAVAFILFCVLAYISWASLKAEEISRFVDEFGSRVEKYMHLAIDEPEAFEAMKGRSSERGSSVGF
jgi:hypothetical protein